MVVVPATGSIDVVKLAGKSTVRISDPLSTRDGNVMKFGELEMGSDDFRRRNNG